MSPMTDCFAVKRAVPLWREDPTLPEGGYFDQFHTVHVSEAEYKRLQDDGLVAKEQQWLPTPSPATR